MNSNKRKIIVWLLCINKIRKSLERKEGIERLQEKIKEDGGHPDFEFTFPKY